MRALRRTPAAEAAATAASDRQPVGRTAELRCPRSLVAAVFRAPRSASDAALKAPQRSKLRAVGLAANLRSQEIGRAHV